VVGFTQMFLIYAAVRFSIFYSPEFDQRIDGIIYGTAAGVGYATLLNISAVLDGGGINLQGGVIRIVVTALVYSALGGLIGYVIARGKFDVEPVWWTPLGVALAASITGVFLWLRGAITQTPLQISADGVTGGYNPFPALMLALALAMALLGLVIALTRRANRLTVTGADSDTQ
jgi:RsiW-degrading membrane proteinase PrsW (M82 family)